MKKIFIAALAFTIVVSFIDAGTARHYDAIKTEVKSCLLYRNENIIPMFPLSLTEISLSVRQEELLGPDLELQIMGPVPPSTKLHPKPNPTLAQLELKLYLTTQPFLL